MVFAQCGSTAELWTHVPERDNHEEGGVLHHGIVIYTDLRFAMCLPGKIKSRLEQRFISIIPDSKHNRQDRQVHTQLHLESASPTRPVYHPSRVSHRLKPSSHTVLTG